MAHLPLYVHLFITRFLRWFIRENFGHGNLQFISNVKRRRAPSFFCSGKTPVIFRNSSLLLNPAFLFILKRKKYKKGNKDNN